MLGLPGAFPFLPSRVFLALLALLCLSTTYYLGTLRPLPIPSSPSYASSSLALTARIPFYIPPSLFPSPHLPRDLPALPALSLNTSTFPAPSRGNTVPPLVHTIYHLSGDRPPPLPYFHYLALRSALLSLRPRLMLMHHHHASPPHGPYWDLLAPHITLSPLTPPQEVYGHRLSHFAHKADVLRLELLIAFGGIYVDIDTYVLRSFDRAGLMTQDVVLGMEASPDSRRTALEPGGLCNAVIVARKDAPFLKRWLATYESFDSSVWAGHSVAKPWELALLYPRELTVLGTRAMFWPLWRGEDIDMVHVPSKADDSGWEFFKSGQLTYHAWESLAMKYLEPLTPSLVLKGESSFTRMVRAFVGPEDLKVEKRLKEAQGS
ncbi:glycosyltransferase family 32 protein [Calocera viscosa TUFC12733]|uniref:Glycosyltransferase family 32 protein n=1 Tax=Calocera viscosa (strain TUFC12733) TaxID=1330018 RepID=A0A167KD79_CALVF|nr:glycosyltransferase family 32 protein [Calocera viscosa TUFC12733]